MIGLFFAAVAVQASPPSAIPSSGRLGFECFLADYAATVASKTSDKRNLAILSTFDRGSGAVLGVLDPTNLLNGTKLSTLALVGSGPKKEDPYQFVIRSAPTAGRPLMLMVEPNGEPVSATERGDFIGVLGFTDQKQPTHIGKCKIVTGDGATRLFGHQNAESATQQ
ncbi:MAG: hypothetical protein HOQ20_01890 [Bradyrhizobium sp.]|nr:hypothetical protein [Bradyrhizobium sp.]